LIYELVANLLIEYSNSRFLFFRLSKEITMVCSKDIRSFFSRINLNSCLRVVPFFRLFHIWSIFLSPIFCKIVSFFPHLFRSWVSSLWRSDMTDDILVCISVPYLIFILCDYDVVILWPDLPIGYPPWLEKFLLILNHLETFTYTLQIRENFEISISLLPHFEFNHNKELLLTLLESRIHLV